MASDGGGLYGDKQYNDRKELIRALEICAKRFNKETILNQCKSIDGRLQKVTDLKRTKIQWQSHFFSIFFSNTCVIT